jgi:hypothetical protein
MLTSAKTEVVRVGSLGTEHRLKRDPHITL